MSKIACVAVVKNEERHIAEWIGYQFAIGFNTVILFDNQSSDGTVGAALQLAGRQDIRIFDWHIVSGEYQTKAYAHAVQMFRDKFDWIAFFDTDEFLVLDKGLDLHSCLAQRVDTAAIAVSWAMFGSSGHTAMPAGLIIENFTQRAPASFFPNLHIKSIVRPQAVRACNNAHMFEIEGAYTDLAGRPITWRQTGLIEYAPDYKLGKLHHYFTRSLAHWSEKLGRGYPVTKRKFEDFATYDRNEIFDDSAKRFAPLVAAILAGKDIAGRPQVPAALVSVSPAIASIQQSRYATQSSLGRMSAGATLEADAARAINLPPTGKPSFHTAFETNPWWQVDLGCAKNIHEIRIYNVLDTELRSVFRNFRISIGFDPDSWIDVFEKDDGPPIGGVDTGPFVWKPDLSAWGRLIRITMLGAGSLHLDHIEIVESTRGSTQRNVFKISDADLFANFISLGDNCEFGLLQRYTGNETLDLLRFTGTVNKEASLITALNERFAAFGDDGDLFINDDGDNEWIARSRRYQTTSHTYRRPREVSYDKIFADESKRRSYLARKLIEDLKTSEKIFIRKSNKPVSPETISKIHTAMQSYGKPILLWVTAADEDHPHATIERIAPRLLHGFIQHLAPYAGANNGNVADWRELCLAALKVVGEQT